MCVLLYASGDMLQLPVKNNMVQFPCIHICVCLCSVLVIQLHGSAKCSGRPRECVE
jgi:hypothetical protein